MPADLFPFALSRSWIEGSKGFYRCLTWTRAVVSVAGCALARMSPHAWGSAGGAFVPTAARIPGKDRRAASTASELASGCRGGDYVHPRSPRRPPWTRRVESRAQSQTWTTSRTNRPTEMGRLATREARTLVDGSITVIAPQEIGVIDVVDPGRPICISQTVGYAPSAAHGSPHGPRPLSGRTGASITSVTPRPPKSQSMWSRTLTRRVTSLSCCVTIVGHSLTTVRRSTNAGTSAAGGEPPPSGKGNPVSSGSGEKPERKGLWSKLHNPTAQAEADTVDDDDVMQYVYYIKLCFSCTGLALVIVALLALPLIMVMDTALFDALGAVGGRTTSTPHSDLRHRDLLPLSNFLSGNFTRGQAVSRVVRRRALRQQRTFDCACAGIFTFCFLGGCVDALAWSSPPLSSLVACVYTFDAYSRVGPPPADCTPEGALRELLGSSRVYHSDRSDIQSYDRHLVSWPVAGFRPVALLDVLPAATRFGLNDWETHLLDSAENATLKRAELVAGRPYYDPERFRTIQSYGTFVGELADRGMLRFRLRDPADPDAAFDILFVRRKKGTLRLIFDTRYFYFGFRASLSTVLPAASSLDSIEVMRDDTGFTMYADFSKCCHGLDVPNSLGQRFTIPSLLARFCGVSTINGAAIPPFAFVEPYVITLPIGCNGGLHPCQMCVSPVVERYVVLDHIVFDRHPGVSISGGQHAGAASFGGLCVICTSRDVADTLLVDIVADSTEIGLCVHDIVQASEHATSVGLELEHNRLSLESSRLCRPRLSIDDIVGRRHCSGARFDVVLGHVTCTPILRHEGLAVLDKVHQYLRDVGDAIGVLRHDAVTGFLQLSRPLPPSTAQISAPCSSQVHCSYASPFGLEVCSQVLPLDVVRDIWRSSEKWTLTALTTCAFTLGMFALTRPPRAKAARMLFSDRTLTLLILLTVMLLSSATAAHSISTPPTISSPTRAAGLHFRHPVLLLHRHGDLPGETGLCDEAISLEQSDGFEGVLLAPTTRRPPKQRLWKATGSMSHQAFVETIDLLHVTALEPTPYRLRRGGASEDLGGRKRSLAELTRRSRCASDMSLTRYTKINQPDVRTRELGPQGFQVRAGNSAGHLGVPLRGEAPSSSSPRALPRPGP